MAKERAYERVKAAKTGLNSIAVWQFAAFLFLLGLETLHLRMPRHCENAQKVAEFLDAHDQAGFAGNGRADAAAQREQHPGVLQAGRHAAARPQQCRVPGALHR